MFDRAASSLIAAAAACAAVAVAVVAAGFALYAFMLPMLGPAGGAAIVAGVAALMVAIYALVVGYRSRRRERESVSSQSQLLETIPALLGDFTRDRPIATLAVSMLGGVLVARNPQLVRDIVSLASSVASRTR